ncbi:MAG: bifunctional nuclease family protein, partial [Anaerolineaceae bacterium]|nr:bifunctional nuclease family protein [Anaerolineaceae bacterium]
VEIDSVRVSLTNQQRIVILKEKEVERYLPVWIGLYEAEAITIALQSIQVARPQTHDLLKTLIHTLNAQLIQVEITSLSDDVFYGNLVLESEGIRKQVDCRPSDALALAARVKVPIYVSESVMEQAGIMPEEDITELESDEQSEPIFFSSADDDLDVFENFLQSIDQDDDDQADEDGLPQSGDEN